MMKCDKHPDCETFACTACLKDTIHHQKSCDCTACLMKRATAREAADEHYFHKHPQLRRCALQADSCKASDCPQHGWLAHVAAGEDALHRATAQVAEGIFGKGREAGPGDRVLIGPDPDGVGGSFNVCMGDTVIDIKANRIGRLIRRAVGAKFDHRVILQLEGEMPFESCSLDIVPFVRKRPTTPEDVAEQCKFIATAGQALTSPVNRHAFLCVSLQTGWFVIACTTCSRLLHENTVMVADTIRRHLRDVDLSDAHWTKASWIVERWEHRGDLSRCKVHEEEFSARIHEYCHACRIEMLEMRPGGARSSS